MNDFELRGIDAPLIEGDLQPVEYGWQCTINVSALIAANITTGPVDECQVFFEVEQNTGQRFVYQSVFKGRQRF